MPVRGYSLIFFLGAGRDAWAVRWVKDGGGWRADPQHCRVTGGDQGKEGTQEEGQDEEEESG